MKLRLSVLVPSYLMEYSSYTDIYENEASCQFLEVNGAEPPVFNIWAFTPLTHLT